MLRKTKARCKIVKARNHPMGLCKFPVYTIYAGHCFETCRLLHQLNSRSSYHYKTSMKVTFIIASSKRLYYTKMLILKEKQVLSFHLEEILEAFKLTNRDRYTFYSEDTFICKCPDDLVLNMKLLENFEEIFKSGKIHNSVLSD